MRRATTLRTLAVIVWFFSLWCLVVALVNGMAWNNPSFKFDVYTFGPLQLNFNNLATGAGTVPEAAFTVLFAVGTVLAIPLGIGLWHQANKQELAEDKNIESEQLPDELNESAKLPKNEDILRDRNKILTTTRLRLISLIQRYKHSHIQEKIVRSMPPVSDVLPTPIRPYNIEVVVPNKPRFKLGDYDSILSVVRTTKNWRIIIGMSRSPVECTMLLEIELLEECLKEALKNRNTPIPIVVQLGNWGTKNLFFEDWLIEYLWQHYDVSTELAEYFIRNNMLRIFLLGVPTAKERTDDSLSALYWFWSNSTTSCVIQQETLFEWIMGANADPFDYYLPSDATVSIYVPESIDSLNSTIPTSE